MAAAIAGVTERRLPRENSRWQGAESSPRKRPWRQVHPTRWARPGLIRRRFYFLVSLNASLRFGRHPEKSCKSPGSLRHGEGDASGFNILCLAAACGTTSCASRPVLSLRSVCRIVALCICLDHATRAAKSYFAHPGAPDRAAPEIAILARLFEHKSWECEALFPGTSESRGDSRYGVESAISCPGGDC